MSVLTAATLAELRAIGDRLAADQLAEVHSIRARVTEAEIAALYRAFRAGIQPVNDLAMGGRFVYAEVGSATVAPQAREAAARALAWAVKDNALGYVPELHWFVPESPGDRSYVARWGRRDWRFKAWPWRVDGWCSQALGEVWLGADLPLLGVIRTTAHEVRHLAQPDAASTEENEADARAYEDRVEGAICAEVIS